MRQRTRNACLVAGLLLAPLLAGAQEPTETDPTAADVPMAEAAPPADPRARLTHDDVEAWLDGFLPYALERGGVAGAVVAVVKDGEIVLSKGYGYADTEARTPVDAGSTLFRPGSVSKLLTWTAVMQQVEAGRIDLDADVNGYLDFEIPPRDGKPVTMRDIMTHTAGFEERLKGLISSDVDNAETLADYIPRWVPNRIYPVGTTPAYSNYATGVAGYIVERVSGETFDDYIDRHILEPLGMLNSTFRQPLPDRLAPQMSKGYQVASGDAKEFEIVNPAPAGSLSSTGTDMAKFMLAHLGEGSYDGGQILKPATAREMHRTFRTLLPPLNRMALGFFETNTNGREVVAHLGDTQWFHTALHLFIDDDVGLYLSVNSLGKDGAAGPIRGALFRMFADRYLPGPEPEGSIGADTAKQHAAMMAGVYDNSRRPDSSFLAALNLFGQVVVVDNGDGTITVNGLDDLAGAPIAWQEIAPFVWVEKGGEDRLAAQVENDAVLRFSVDGIAPFMVFQPTPWKKSSAWLKPLLLASLAALFLTALLWPVTAIVRKRFGASLALAGGDLKAYRYSKLAALATVIVFAAWMATVVAMTTDLNLLAGDFDTLLMALHIVSLLVFVAALLVMAWNARRAWTGARRWPAKTWSVVLVVAALTVLWVAVFFHLINFSVNY